MNNAAMGSLSGETWAPAGSGNGPISWENLGPITDSVWQAQTNYTLPDTTITDPNNNTEGPFRAGVSGTTTPTFATGINQLTNDNPNLIWINLGPASAPAPGTISAFNGGYTYYVALVNSATDTVSNASPASTVTGNFIGAAGVQITGGLPPLANIDPQSDFVAIFPDNGWTHCPVPDLGHDERDLDRSIARLFGERVLRRHARYGLEQLDRGPDCRPEHASGVRLDQPRAVPTADFSTSIGNTVYYTSGPDTPVGNGFEGAGPDNFQELPSKVVRLVPTIVGIFIFTVSDIYLIANTGGSIPPAVFIRPKVSGF
jgi:hypothetical protein